MGSSQRGLCPQREAGIVTQIAITKEGQRLEIEVLDPPRYFLVKDREYPTIAVGRIWDTSNGNIEFWDMWSFTLHWPWIRHVRAFVEN